METKEVTIPTYPFSINPKLINYEFFFFNNQQNKETDKII
jgi:hypothetical protein